MFPDSILPILGAQGYKGMSVERGWDTVLGLHDPSNTHMTLGPSIFKPNYLLIESLHSCEPCEGWQGGVWGPAEGSLQGCPPWECCERMAVTGKQSINNTGGQVWAKGHHRTAIWESYQGHGTQEHRTHGAMEARRRKVNRGNTGHASDKGGWDSGTTHAFSSTAQAPDLQARHAGEGLGNRSL